MQMREILHPGVIKPRECVCVCPCVSVCVTWGRLGGSAVRAEGAEIDGPATRALLKMYTAFNNQIRGAQSGSNWF